MTDSQRAREGYATSNLEFACILAASPELYPGLPQLWADIVLSRAARPDDAEAGALFAKVA